MKEKMKNRGYYLPEYQVDWIERQAKVSGLSLNKVLSTVLETVIRREKEEKDSLVEIYREGSPR